jgi:hypothetical protein
LQQSLLELQAQDDPMQQVPFGPQKRFSEYPSNAKLQHVP